jgi:tetratricopeptide (TPR) repeat protein
MRYKRFAIAIGTSVFLAAGGARATPTVWAKARSPAVHREAAALDAADHEDAMEKKTEKILHIELPGDVTKIHRLRAKRALEEAGARTSKNPVVVARLASILHDLDEYADSAVLDREVVTSNTVASLKADAYSDLAIAYARLGRVDDEIAAYESGLAFDTIGRSRAVLLSNQAEAYMVKGDVTRAIAGYRASIDSLSSYELPLASTTLWSLGVALDRSGDLEGALASIARARTYDPNDSQLQPPRWFFVPDYDAAWYAALGELLVARTAKDPWVRQAAYVQSIDDWRDYVKRAAADDPYLPIGRARLKLTEKEAKAFDASPALHQKKPEPEESLRIHPLPLPH